MAAGGQASAVSMRPLASEEAVREWARRARPGETFVYHSGAFLVKSLPAVRAADRLVAEGEALMFQRKVGPSHYDYIVQKRANAERQLSAGQLAGRAIGNVIDQDEYDQLLAVLRRLANFSLPCPTNAELAREAKLPDGESVRYRLKKLEEAGLIRVRIPAEGCVRRVTIVASGRSTGR